MNKLLEQIESAIRNQEHSLMGDLITRYLKSERYSKEARLTASEFYRRISQYSKGLELLHWQNESFNWKSLPEHEIRIRLQSIRLLNLLGASQFAVNMLDMIDFEIQKKYYELIAPIYLSNGRDAEAGRLYSFLEKLPVTELNYQMRLRLIGLADSYAGLEKFEQSIELGERLLEKSTEPVMLAILNEALGSYHVRSGNLKKAAKYHEKAQSFYQPDDQTVDHGYLLKWVGARLVLEGKWVDAEKMLSRSLSILDQKGIKPEVWLEVYFWKGLLEFKKHPKILPQEWKMLLGYPTVGQGFKKQISKWIDLPSEVSFNENPKMKSCLYFQEDMKVERGKNSLGLSLPEKILSLLLAAGQGGVPFYRVCDAIYDDLHSFGQHFKRLDQGLGRLRSDGIEVEWKDMHLHLIPNQKSAQYQAVVNLERTIPGGLFFKEVLRKNPARFSREEVEKYFSLSRSRAAALCQKWVEEGRLNTEKEGRSVFYSPRVSAE